MTRVITPIFISLAWLALTGYAAAEALENVVSVETADGRTVVGQLVDQTQPGAKLRYRGLSAVVTESLHPERVVAVTPVLPPPVAKPTVEDLTARFEKATLAEIAEFLLFPSHQR